MTNYEFYDRLRAMLAERIVQEGDNLARGLAVDFPDYRRRCGCIAGMQDALADAKEIHDQLTGG